MIGNVIKDYIIHDEYESEDQIEARRTLSVQDSLGCVKTFESLTKVAEKVQLTPFRLVDVRICVVLCTYISPSLYSV